MRCEDVPPCVGAYRRMPSAGSDVAAARRVFLRLNLLFKAYMMRPNLRPRYQPRLPGSQGLNQNREDAP
jgi:hypothetical protein